MILFPLYLSMEIITDDYRDLPCIPTATSGLVSNICFNIISYALRMCNFNLSDQPRHMVGWIQTLPCKAMLDGSTLDLHKATSIPLSTITKGFTSLPLSSSTTRMMLCEYCFVFIIHSLRFFHYSFTHLIYSDHQPSLLPM